MTSLILEYSAPQRVYVENEWYDGPRVGVTDLNGKPHRFWSQYDEQEDEYMGTFLVWPIEDSELALEQEQWEIFVTWNEQYEAGLVSSKTHPGHLGVNKRWDEIDLLLAACRAAPPQGAKRARAQVIYIEGQQRYATSGPAYQMSWRLL
ncbi:hypothetical protein [Chitinimonas naiadis]